MWRTRRASDADTAKFLQTVAWQTVQEYYGVATAATATSKPN